jgi:chromate transporter
MVAMRGFRGFVRGANVAVVGILLAALYSPIGTEGVRSVRDGAAVVIAILLMARLRLPQWALVALMAAAGQWLLR